MTISDSPRPGVLLLHPRGAAEPVYPIPLATIAALLRARGHVVLCGDLHFENVGDLVERARAAGGIGWLGGTCLPHNAGAMATAIDALRRAFPSAGTFVAGALPTLDPARSLRETGAAVAVVGEPEAIVARLVADPFADGEPPLPGCVVTRGGNVRDGGPAPRIPLGELPLPDRAAFPIERYSHAVRAVARPYAAILTSRGCGRGCAFCPVDALHSGGFDARPVEQVHAEMEALARDQGVRSVHIEDDHFLQDRARVLALCELLRRRPLPVVWEIMNGVRAESADGELLAAMGAAGCRRIVFGLEHIGGDDLGVGCTEALARAVVANARRAGMRVGGYFMVGLPGVGFAGTLAALRRALRLGLDYAKFTPYWFAPGSAWGRRQRELAPGCLPASLVRNLCRIAELSFLARPRPFARLVRDLAADPEVARVMVGRAVELLRHGGPVPMRD